MDADTLKTIGDLSAIGVLGLFIILVAVCFRLTLSFIKEQIVPIATNHLRHVERSFDDLAISYKTLQNEQHMHNELTVSLVEQVKIQNELLKTHSQLLREGLLDR